MNYWPLVEETTDTKGQQYGYRFHIVNIGSGNGLATVRRQAITWTNDVIMG